jgi:hypothetical protein
MVVAMLAAGTTASMAAGGVGEVGGIDSANTGVATGGTTPFGGGGSSFAAPGGIDSGPGLVGGLMALARPGVAPAASRVVGGTPRSALNPPGTVGSGKPAVSTSTGPPRPAN